MKRTTNFTLINDSLNKNIQQDWGKRHWKEWVKTDAHPIVEMVCALARYGDKYAKDYPDNQLGNDYVLGEAWLKIMQATRDLLNGDCGNLDCGTIDGLLITMALNEGFKPEEVGA